MPPAKVKERYIMIFEFTDMNRRAATTNIEQHGNLIIVTELATNEGASVTNSAEYIATQYATQNGIPFDAIKFVERYDSRSYENGRKPLKGEFPTLDLVTFQYWREERQKSPNHATMETHNRRGIKHID